MMGIQPIIKTIINYLNEYSGALMVVITFAYVLATIGIMRSNNKSAKAAKDALDESKNQFEQSFELQKQQFDKSIELQRQHNYDSVRPAVTVGFSSSNSIDGNTFSGSITIANHGLGPAILKELEFKKNNKEYKNTNGYCTLYDLINFRLSEEHQENLPVKEIFHHYYSKEFRNDSNNRDYLAVGEKLVLLEFNTRNKWEGDVVGKLFHGVHMELVYTDIYDSCDWTVSNRLSYFKPNWIEKRRVYQSDKEESLSQNKEEESNGKDGI